MMKSAPVNKEYSANELRHLAIIMDGNGRWAEQRGLSRIEGHKAGAQAVRRTIEGCRDLGIKYLTLYAFSYENWHRPKQEVEQLMQLLVQFLKERRRDLHKHHIRLLAIGELEKLPPEVRAELSRAEAESKDYDRGTLILALSYGGRQEIIRAARRFAAKVAEGLVEPGQLNENLFHSHLDTAGIPDPDLIIRTSGEIRLSNFLLWQASYSELRFTETLWPDFGQGDLKQAAEDFRNRRRRFGKRG